MSYNTETLSRTIDLSAPLRRTATRECAQLAVVHPPKLARRIPLRRGATVFGRDAHTADAVLPRKTVSRRHFRVRWDGRMGTALVEDLNSHNGSWLDGRPLDASPRPLRDGAVLRAGSVVAVYEVRPAALTDAVELADVIPGGSPQVARLRREIARAAPDPSPVLVTGATGVGKEHAVRAMHDLSGRSGPFVPVNVAELNPQLIDSQLFGHRKGAFSGADRAQPGLFRHAAGGTLFLDELGELPLELQPKLLRVIQEGEVRPVGATSAERVDVRIVAATNRDLAAEVERGTFRRDLWARLTLLELRVPTLADRRGDILEWIGLLHRRWCRERGRRDAAALSFDSRTVEAILLMHWPENLRGLDRLVHRLALEAEAEPDPDWPRTHEQLLALIGARTDDEPDAGERKAEAEKEEIKRPAPTTSEELEEALNRFDWSIRATAKWYGRHRRQIYRWMEAFGLERGGG